jgi:hypothetical protein
VFVGHDTKRKCEAQRPSAVARPPHRPGARAQANSSALALWLTRRESAAHNRRGGCPSAPSRGACLPSAVGSTDRTGSPQTIRDWALRDRSRTRDRPGHRFLASALSARNTLRCFRLQRSPQGPAVGRLGSELHRTDRHGLDAVADDAHSKHRVADKNGVLRRTAFWKL